MVDLLVVWATLIQHWFKVWWWLLYHCNEHALRRWPNIEPAMSRYSVCTRQCRDPWHPASIFTAQRVKCMLASAGDGGPTLNWHWVVSFWLVGHCCRGLKCLREYTFLVAFIFQSTNETLETLGPYCGDHKISSLTVRASRVSIYFTSDGSVQRRGFSIFYKREDYLFKSEWYLTNYILQWSTTKVEQTVCNFD